MNDADITFADGEGPFFLGFVLSLVLYGWYLSQVSTYYRHCRQDHIGVLAGVAVLTVFETANMIASAQGFYTMLITRFGDLDSIRIPISIYVYYLLNPLTVVMVQLFFIYRLYRLLEARKSDNLILALTAAAALASSGLGIQFAASSIKGHATGIIDLHRYKFIGALLSGLSVLCDALITWGLCRGLAASRNGFPSTERTIDGISAFLLNRGVMLLVVQTASFIAFLASSNVEIQLFFPGMLAKLYANSLVSFLIAFEPQRLGLRMQKPAIDAHGATGAHHNIHLGVLQTTEVRDGYDPRFRDSMIPSVKLAGHV